MRYQLTKAKISNNQKALRRGWDVLITINTISEVDSSFTCLQQSDEY